VGKEKGGIKDFWIECIACEREEEGRIVCHGNTFAVIKNEADTTRKLKWELKCCYYYEGELRCPVTESGTVTFAPKETKLVKLGYFYGDEGDVYDFYLRIYDENGNLIDERVIEGVRLRNWVNPHGLDVEIREVRHVKTECPEEWYCEAYFDVVIKNKTKFTVTVDLIYTRWYEGSCILGKKENIRLEPWEEKVVRISHAEPPGRKVTMHFYLYTCDQGFRYDYDELCKKPIRYRSHKSITITFGEEPPELPEAKGDIEVKTYYNPYTGYYGIEVEAINNDNVDLTFAGEVYIENVETGEKYTGWTIKPTTVPAGTCMLIYKNYEITLPEGTWLGCAKIDISHPDRKTVTKEKCGFF